MGELYPKQYAGSATVAVSPQHAWPAPKSLDPGAASPSVALAAAIRQRQAGVDWPAIVDRYRLYPDLVASSGKAAAAAYLASQITLQPAPAPDLGTEAVRFTYSGTRLEKVAGVIDSLVDSFTKTDNNASPSSRTAEAIDPLYAPVVLPTIHRLAEPQPGRRRVEGSRGAEPGITAAAISLQLQASLDRGATLRQAAQQSAANLDQLRQDYRAAEQKMHSAAAPAPVAERKSDPQEERLHQELARAQNQLAALRERYTDEYPDVVAARQKVADIQLDISRIAAIAPSAPKQQTNASSQAAKAIQVEVDRVAAQIGEAEAAQNSFRASIESNDRETARLRTQLATASRTPTMSPRADSDHPPMPAPMSKTDPVAPSKVNAEPSGAPRFFLVHPTVVKTHPAIFSVDLLFGLSLVFGAMAALFATWLAERRDPSIRNEGMLRHELPASAVFLGGIPRIRHEIITD